MPTSPSPRRGGKTRESAAPRRSPWPRLALLGALAALGVAASTLPASMVAHFLPATVHAEDFSGSIWHGSAGRITANGRDAGAVEWHLHPYPLLRQHVAADLHWVKGGFVLDGAVDVRSGELAASNVEGGGPVADLRDLGLAAGWRGTAAVRIEELDALLSPAGAVLRSAVGEIDVSDISAQQVAGGADLGGYSLKFADGAIADDGDAAAKLTDTGGPLELDAAVHLSGKSRSGLVSGTVKARPDAPAALTGQLDNLAQLHARDTQGRIPIDLEFTF